MLKNKVRLILFTVLLFGSVNTFGQNIRGFYLSGITNWLGNATKETEILQYAQGNGFNYICLYNLTLVNWNSTAEKNKLASFIAKATTQYGIIQVGAVVENYAFVVNNILPYNNSRTNTNEKFNVINLEFEFWSLSSINNSYCARYLSPNGYSCDTAGAWKFGWKQFKLIDSVCATHGLISEVYLGWPNKGQMQQLASIADRILLHAYRPNDGDVYAYSRNRLIDIASINTKTKVIPLFSGEPVFMGPWLNSHSVSTPYQTYSNDFNAETASFKQNIDLQGYQWFTYNYLPHTIAATATINSSGPLSICGGGSVTLTANSGASYLWTPGGQTTQSVTVSSAGSYTVAVTNVSGVSVTSLPAIVTISSSVFQPTVTANGSTTFCAGGSVILTSSVSGSYLWSNGATTQSISVVSSGNYSVTAGNGSCSATSVPVNVNANSSSQIPVITAGGSLNLCSGSQLVLTSSAANGYLWSNGATTRSIAIASPGNYFVRTYSGPNCSAQSVVQTVTQPAPPTIPVITANGSLTLTSTHQTVTLTSSASASYLWSTGEMTRAITVDLPGTYRSTVTDTNGCTATSAPVSVNANGCVTPPIPSIIVVGSKIISNGQTVTLTSTSATRYLWSNGATTNSITVSDSGTYFVKTFNSGDCFSTSLPVNIIMMPDENVAVPEMRDKIQGKVDFSLFPNPAVDELNILISAETEKEINLKLMDLTGREIQNRVIMAIAGENRLVIDVSNLTRGIYLASLYYEKQKQTIKVIVQ